jgi:UDP-N-acetylglucosamine 2-epimerase (non-hydrolysing)
MNKLIITFGTRPELIKLAPVIQEFRNRELDNQLVIVHTGQHCSLTEPLLVLFDIKPDYYLDTMSENSSLSGLTARVLERFQTVLDDVKKTSKIVGVLAQGDTTSVLATALCAFYNHLPFFHLEAGLRTHNINEPFPEELNRRVASMCTTVHFAPTKKAKDNLLKEKAAPDSIVLVGNTIVDALNWVIKTIPTGPSVSENPIVLITCHRRENHGKNLKMLIEAVSQLALKHKNVDFIWLLHPNPNVQEIVLNAGLERLSNIELRPPIDYFEMINLLKHTHLLLTDSGGLQEEAPSFDVDTLVLRDTTERPEGIKLGYATLVGCDNVAKILEAFEKHYPIHRQITQNPYGDGLASVRIVDYLAAKYLAPTLKIESVFN